MQDVCRMLNESRVQLLVDADSVLHTTATCGKVGTFHGCGLGNDTGMRGEEGEDRVLGCSRGLVGRGVG